MADMTDTLDESGTDQATPDQADTAAEWDYFDPDEDTEEAPADEVTDDGTTDQEDPEHVDETDDAEGEPEDTEESEGQDLETFELANGETVTRDELLNGYLRQSDYTAKTTNLAQSRQAVQAEAQRITDLFEGAIDYFTAMVPNPPDDSLAATDPGQHYAQRVAYENALRAIQQIRDMAGTAKQSSNAVTQDQMREVARAENAKLLQFVPEAATKKGRDKFFGAVGEAAQFYGFTAEEMNGILDNRLFRMAHDAALWRRSQATRAQAKAKVAKAPPAVPARPGGKAKSSGNRDAIKRLSRSGSIHDAVKVDWAD